MCSLYRRGEHTAKELRENRPAHRVSDDPTLGGRQRGKKLRRRSGVRHAANIRPPEMTWRRIYSDDGGGDLDAEPANLHQH